MCAIVSRDSAFEVSGGGERKVRATNHPYFSYSTHCVKRILSFKITMRLAVKYTSHTYTQEHSVTSLYITTGFSCRKERCTMSMYDIIDDTLHDAFDNLLLEKGN